MESLGAQIREAWLKGLEEDPKVDRTMLEALRKALTEHGTLDREMLRTILDEALDVAARQTEAT